MIIGISGKIKSGKDTVAEILNREMDNKFKLSAYADPLKECCSLILGIPVEDMFKREVKEMNLGPEWDNMTVREFIQKFGTEGCRQGVHENIWVNSMFARNKGVENLIITDVRFESEATDIKERGGIVIRVDRPFYQRFPEHGVLCNLDYPYELPLELKKHDPELYNKLTHISETELDRYDGFDYEILNDVEDINVLTDKIIEFILFYEQGAFKQKAVS